jgi:drug/metabolite transporter (DMT)-like permease
MDGARELVMLVMLGSAIMFGSYAPNVKAIFMLPGPPTVPALTAARGVLIALPLLPQLCGSRADGAPALTRNALRAAAELALYSAGLTAAITVGLAQGGSATKGAFLLSSYAVFTPCLALAAGERVAGETWLGALLALVGVGCIVLDDADAAAGPRADLLRLDWQDGCFVAGALAAACTIFRMGRFATSHELAERVVPMEAAKNVLLAAGYSAWLGADVLARRAPLAEQWPGAAEPRAVALVVASAALAGVLGDLLHALGGRGMPTSEANVILSSEPLWAALLTALLLHERRGPLAYAGGALLVGAAVVSTAERSDCLPANVSSSKRARYERV